MLQFELFLLGFQRHLIRPAHALAEHCAQVARDPGESHQFFPEHSVRDLEDARITACRDQGRDRFAINCRQLANTVTRGNAYHELRVFVRIKVGVDHAGQGNEYVLVRLAGHQERCRGRHFKHFASGECHGDGCDIGIAKQRDPGHALMAAVMPAAFRTDGKAPLPALFASPEALTHEFGHGSNERSTSEP
jgi:hypothetical protein